MKLNINASVSDVNIAMQHLEMAVQFTDNVDIKKDLVYNIYALGLLKNKIADSIDNEKPVTKAETLDD
jgi:hypothetical protein